MVWHHLLGDVRFQQKEGNEILGNNLGKSMIYRGRREMKEYEVTSKENTELKEAEQVLYHHLSWFQGQSGELRALVIVNSFPEPAHGMQH